MLSLQLTGELRQNLQLYTFTMNKILQIPPGLANTHGVRPIEE